MFATYLAKDLFKKEKTTKPFLEKISFLNVKHNKTPCLL